MSVGITGFIGPEGAGKTCLMTAYCHAHVKLGGKLFTFPGYQLTDGNGKVLSEEIKPEQWASLPEELNNTVIAIDEINNFFDAYRYNAVMAGLFTSLQQQRRHRNLGLLFTIQNEQWLPPRMRQLTHYYIRCFDLYWSYHSSDEPIERGNIISFTIEDCKGFQRGIPGFTIGPSYFHAKKYWPLYNTYAIVDIFQKYQKIKIKQPEIIMDFREEVEQSQVPPGFEPPAFPSQTTVDKMALVDRLLEKGAKVGEIDRILKGMK